MDDEFDLEDELERELEAGAEMDTDEQPQGASEAGEDEQTPNVAVSSLAADEVLSSSAVMAVEPSGLGQDDALTAKAREQQRKMEILKLLTPEQEHRYEAFMRSRFEPASMRKLLHSATGQAPHPNAVIVMRGIAKLFVGDIVETARMVAAEEGEEGPLQPKHIRAAYQRLDKSGKIPHRAKKPRMMRL